MYQQVLIIISNTKPKGKAYHVINIITSLRAPIGICTNNEGVCYVTCEKKVARLSSGNWHVDK